MDDRVDRVVSYVLISAGRGSGWTASPWIPVVRLRTWRRGRVRRNMRERR